MEPIEKAITALPVRMYEIKIVSAVPTIRHVIAFKTLFNGLSLITLIEVFFGGLCLPLSIISLEFLFS